MSYSIRKLNQNTIVDKSNSFNSSNLNQDPAPKDWHIVFIFSSLSFILGLLLGTLSSVGLIFPVWIFCLCSITTLAVGIFSPLRRRIFYFGLIFSVGLAGGLFRSVTQIDYQTELDSYLDKKNTLNALIVSEPDERETLTKLVVRPEDYQVKILVTVERYPQYRLGDSLSLQGKISKPKNIFNTKGTQFYYRAFLAKDGIYYEMYKPQASLFSRPTFGPLIFLANLKNRLINTMNEILPEPESSLLAGILLGAKKGLGTEITNNFKQAGVSHILVLSGYNITFVALVLLRICALLPRFVGGGVGFISIIAFGLLAGGGSVVWRAVLMSLIALYAKLTGRMFDVTAGIIFSAVALVAYNPATLTADLGFQLSIMAMIGIVYIAPVLKDKIFYRISEKYGFQELICSTFGAQLAVMPLLWQTTGQISIIGFVSNLVILPFVPYSMMVGALAVLIGFISPLMAWPISFVAYLLLKSILSLASFFSHLPFSGLTVAPSSWFFMTFVYILIFWPVTIFWFNFNKKIKV